MQPFWAGSLVIASYLLGSVPFAWLLGLSRGVDIRRRGSGNIGATNLGRILGRRWGIAAFLADFAKGLAPVVLARFLFPGGDAIHLPLAAGCAAIAGHVLPVWLRFRGGKGVATTFGVLAALAWAASLAAGVVWLALFRVTRVVSLASLGAAVAFPLGVWWSRGDPPSADHAAVQVFSIAVAALIFVRHRANIRRLLRGEEFGFRQSSSGTEGEAAREASEEKKEEKEEKEEKEGKEEKLESPHERP